MTQKKIHQEKERDREGHREVGQGGEEGEDLGKKPKDQRVKGTKKGLPPGAEVVGRAEVGTAEAGREVRADTVADLGQDQVSQVEKGKDLYHK